MIPLRLYRSIQTPAKVPMIAFGSKPTTLAIVRASAEPVCTVIHQIIQNWTALEFSSENAWPI